MRMKELEKFDDKVQEWFKDKSAKHWSRSHFTIGAKCDLLLNNLCKTFNCNILDAREKPVLTMLEWIRHYLMTRLQQNRDRAIRKWDGKILCPKIEKLLEQSIEKSSDCITIKSDDSHYEIHCYDGARYVVNLPAEHCTCRRWSLIGIPCKHTVSTIHAQGLDPMHFVHSCYHVKTYFKVYAPAIYPMNGGRLWWKTGFIPPLPTNKGRGAGKPVKTRRLEPDEIKVKTKKGVRGKKKVTRFPRMPYTVECKHCGVKDTTKGGVRQENVRRLRL